MPRKGGQIQRCTGKCFIKKPKIPHLWKKNHLGVVDHLIHKARDETELSENIISIVFITFFLIITFNRKLLVSFVCDNSNLLLCAQPRPTTGFHTSDCPNTMARSYGNVVVLVASYEAPIWI